MDISLFCFWLVNTTQILRVVINTYTKKDDLKYRMVRYADLLVSDYFNEFFCFDSQKVCSEQVIISKEKCDNEKVGARFNRTTNEITLFPINNLISGSGGVILFPNALLDYLYNLIHEIIHAKTNKLHKFSRAFDEGITEKITNKIFHDATSKNPKFCHRQMPREIQIELETKRSWKFEYDDGKILLYGISKDGTYQDEQNLINKLINLVSSRSLFIDQTKEEVEKKLVEAFLFGPTVMGITLESGLGWREEVRLLNEVLITLISDNEGNNDSVNDWIGEIISLIETRIPVKSQLCNKKAVSN
jgi:hypothetical protein